MTILMGIDYSLTSPACCVFNGNEWNFENCTFYYFTKAAKNLFVNDRYKGIIYEDYTNDCDRYEKLMKRHLKIIQDEKVTRVAIEGYAFGAAGRIFSIAENTAILKYHMWKNSTKYEIYAPGEIKKFATGKGNANKQLMFDAFQAETNLDVFSDLNVINRNNWNPVSDIIDSYYICKLLHQKMSLQP